MGLVGKKVAAGEVDGTGPGGGGGAAPSPGSSPPCTTNLHLLLLLQCFMLPSHTPLPSLPIAAPLLAIFPNWLKVPLNTSSKQNTQECWRLFTPNFGSLHFRDTNRYWEKYFSGGGIFRFWTLLGKLCCPEMLLYFQTFLTAFKITPILIASFDKSKF